MDLKNADRQVKMQLTQMHTINNDMNVTPAMKDPLSPTKDSKYATLDPARIGGRF